MPLPSYLTAIDIQLTVASNWATGLILWWDILLETIYAHLSSTNPELVRDSMALNHELLQLSNPTLLVPRAMNGSGRLKFMSSQSHFMGMGSNRTQSKPTIGRKYQT